MNVALSEIATWLLPQVRKRLAPYDDGDDVTETTPLISAARLDSLAVMGLVEAIERHYGLMLSAGDWSTGQFDSIEKMARLIARKAV